MIAGQAAWSGSYAAMKIALGELPVGAIIFLRYAIATFAYLFLAPVVGTPRFERRDWLLAILAGTLNFVVAPSLQVSSLRYTQAIDVSILTALEPALTVLLAGIILRETLSKRTWAAVALGFCGMVILSGAGAQTGEVTTARLIGNAMFVGSLLFEVSVTIAGGRLARKYPPLPAMAAMKAIGCLVSGLVYAPVIAGVDYAALGLRTWAAVGYLGLLASLFSYTAWYYAIRKAPVNRVALSLFVQPITGTALGYLLVGESIGPNTLIGALLICGGLAWLEARKRAGAEKI